MKIISETERLFLREATEDDADFLLELVNTPAWHTYIGDRDVRSIAAAKEYIENGPLKSYRENGFGSYCLVLKENGTRIGMCGLYKRDSLTYADLGFALLPAFEGKGYASEASRAIIQLSKDLWNMHVLLAITAQNNDRSMNLLKRIGFRPEGNVQLPGDHEKLNLFRLDL